MTDILLFASFILLIVSIFLFRKLVGNTVVAAFYGLYTSIFIAILPAMYIGGSHFLSISSTYNIYMPSYIRGCFIFVLLSTFIFFIFGIVKIKPRSLLPGLATIKTIRNQDVMIVSSVFFGISYLALSHINGSFFYMLSHINEFSLVQDIKRGGWVFVVLSSCYIYPFLLSIDRMATGKNPIARLSILTVVFMLTSIFVFKADNRSVLIIYIITAYLAYQRARREDSRTTIKSLVSLALLALFIVYILIVGNQWRMGDASFFPSKSDFLLFLSILQENFLQVENSLVLLHYFSFHNYVGYKYLGAVISGYAMIPSVILPFHKIDTGLESILTIKLFGSSLPRMYAPNSTLTFTIPFSGYAEGGYLGLAITSSMYSILLSVVGVTYKLSKDTNRVFVSFVLLITILAFRLSLESTIITAYISLLFYVTIAILTKIRI